MFLKFMVFWGVRAQVRGAISPILRCSPLFAAILGPECLGDFLFKVFLIFGSVPVESRALGTPLGCGAAVEQQICYYGCRTANKKLLK